MPSNVRAIEVVLVSDAVNTTEYHPSPTSEGMLVVPAPAPPPLYISFRVKDEPMPVLGAWVVLSVIVNTTVALTPCLMSDVMVT